jgi:phosphorylase/glycogen(starch) synthase
MNGSKAEYAFKLDADETGVFDVGFRIFPKHVNLPHRMDFPLVRWI